MLRYLIDQAPAIIIASEIALFEVLARIERRHEHHDESQH